MIAISRKNVHDVAEQTRDFCRKGKKMGAKRKFSQKIDFILLLYEVFCAKLF